MLNKIFIAVIKVYQYTLGTVLPNSCRFTPSCSEYTFQAFTRYGVKAGGLLALKRILRCHPFSSGGYDPVPEEGKVKEKATVKVKEKEEPSALTSTSTLISSQKG